MKQQLLKPVLLLFVLISSTAYTQTLTTGINMVDASCYGLCNGSAAATPTGGTLPYTYSWTPGGGAGQTVSNLCAGTYTLVVTDALGATAMQTGIVQQPAAITSTPSSTQAFCGGANGTASVTVSGGTPGYSYTWAPAPGSGQGTANVSGLSAGTYTITVKDSKGCTNSSAVTVTNATGPIAPLGLITNATCYNSCDGNATVNASGGTGPYTYSWNPSGGTTATVSNLCAGNYTCEITDANGCYTTQVAAISEPAPLSANTNSTNVQCNGSCTGTATVNATGGTGTFTYNWSPAGGTTTTASNLCPGTYTCFITDANGCSITQVAAISQPAPLSANINNTNISCYGGSNGTATATVNGGTAGYTYSWTPAGGNLATATNLAAGTYTFYVTDANGCSNFSTVAISQPTLLVSNISSTTNVQCNGMNNGAATITASGGTGVLNYSWTPVVGGGQGTPTATGLTAATYTVVTTDANGCISTTTVTINQPTALTSISTSTNSKCNGSYDGTATVLVQGGVPGYTYTWMPPPATGQGTTANGLPAGTYTFTCNDAHGCSVTVLVTITQPTILGIVTTTSTSESCTSCCDATASINPTGGTFPYIYSWNCSPSQQTQTASALCSGTYSICVTDANGCGICDTVSVSYHTGIASLTESFGIQIYPNPASGILHLSFPSGYSQSVRLSILNILGEAVYTEQNFIPNPTGKTLSIDQLPKGIYFLQLSSGNKQHTIRFLKT